MSRSSLRVAVSGAMLALAAAVWTTTPAYACHEPTGWCCVTDEHGHGACCYFINNQLILESCFEI